MNCPGCGAAITEGKFCSYCGAKLPEEPKIDVKTRDYKISISNEASVRKAEIKKEMEANRQEHVRQVMDKRQKSNNLFLIFGILFVLLCFIMSLLSK